MQCRLRTIVGGGGDASAVGFNLCGKATAVALYSLVREASEAPLRAAPAARRLLTHGATMEATHGARERERGRKGERGWRGTEREKQ